MVQGSVGGRIWGRGGGGGAIPEALLTGAPSMVIMPRTPPVPVVAPQLRIAKGSPENLKPLKRMCTKRRSALR